MDIPDIDPEMAQHAVDGLVRGFSQVLAKDTISFFGRLGLTALTSSDRLVRDKWKKISGNYFKSYVSRHGIVKALGMPEPVSLDKIYTTVKILDNQAVSRYSNVRGLQEIIQEEGRLKFAGDEEKRIGIEVANEHQYLMVLGAPGAGKTTFLRRVGMEALKGRSQNYQHRCIPMFLELRTFRDKEKFNLEEAIAEEFRNCGLSKGYQRDTQKLLEAGKLLVIFDGLDEVEASRFGEMVNVIQNFVHCYPKNRYIASCRSAAYHYNFRSFSDITVADFDDEQIESFVNNWFSAHERDN